LLLSNSDGCVTIPLPDDRSGKLHVRTLGGWYWSAVHRDDKDEPVRIYAPSQLGVTATFPYAPSRPATTLSDGNASYATTWADAWAIARLGVDTTPEQMVEILQEGYSRLGQHFGRDLDANGLDIRTATPRDLIGRTRHSSATSEPSTRLGVVQAAIARCAADWSVANGSAPDALPSLSLAADVIAHDAGNLYYDGLDMRETRVNVMGKDLDQNTLRHTLVTCGALWLDSTSNRTTLRARNFSQADGFFPVVSANQDRQLFGSSARDFRVFDRTAPELAVVLVDQDLLPLPLRPVPVDRALILRIVASDDGGFSGPDGLIRPVVSITPGPALALGDPIVHSASRTEIGVTYVLGLHSLNEGEQTISMFQADAVSNVAEIEPIKFLVDRTPPSLLVHPLPGLVSGTEDGADVPVSWLVDEDTERLVVRVGSVEHIVNLNSSLNEAKVPLPHCNDTFPVTLRAYDFAGNGSDPVGPYLVACDMYDPFVTLKESRHRQEHEAKVKYASASMEVVDNTDEAHLIDISQPGPHDIVHFKNRYYSGHEAMPFIEFQAADVGDVMTDDAGVEVEYFYTSSAGASFEAWRPAARKPGTSRRYKIELSPDKLLPSIYETTAEELHTVTIRARDAAGRYSEEVAVQFRLHLLMPPMILSNGRLSGEMTSRSLQDGTMHEFFSNRDSAEVLTMQVYWPWGHGNAPTHNATLDLGAAEMATRISVLQEAKHIGDYRWDDLGSWSCGDSGHRIAGGRCRQGLAPVGGAMSAEEPPTHHTMLYDVEGAIHIGWNRFEIMPNRAYTIRVRVRRPRVDRHGSPYRWNRRHGQYEYEARAGQEYDKRELRSHPDFHTKRWYLHVRPFSIQTYVSEVLVDLAPLAVDAHVGDRPADVVPAVAHESCMNAWSFASSTH
jgi:hypothetical protein